MLLESGPARDDRSRLAGWWHCIFERHWSLRGMTIAFTDYYTDPASVHRSTGPFFRETIFDEFFAPYYREPAERAHARGMTRTPWMSAR